MELFKATREDSGKTVQVESMLGQEYAEDHRVVNAAILAARVLSIHGNGLVYGVHRLGDSRWCATVTDRTRRRDRRDSFAFSLVLEKTLASGAPIQ